MHAATCALAWVVAAVEHCKANTSLTGLYLDGNIRGGRRGHCTCRRLAGNGLTCGQQLFRACACCHRKCHCYMDGVNSWLRRADMQFVFLHLAFFFRPQGKHAVTRIVLKLMWPGSRIDWVVSVLSCTLRARHRHLPSCGAPPHHVIRTVVTPCEQRPFCDLTRHDMARQDMAFRFEETSSTVDTIQHVVGRQRRDTTAQNAP